MLLAVFYHVRRREPPTAPAGALPWMGQKSGRPAITDFVTKSRAMLGRINFEIQDVRQTANER
jgi:hypothetical protein